MWRTERKWESLTAVLVEEVKLEEGGDEKEDKKEKNGGRQKRGKEAKRTKGGCEKRQS